MGVLAFQPCGPGRFPDLASNEMWVEFVVGSLLTPKSFFWVPWSGFPPSKKEQHSKSGLEKRPK